MTEENKSAMCGSAEPMYSAPDVMKAIMRQAGLGPTKFAAAMGVRYQRVNDVVNGRSKRISADLVSAITRSFPFVSRNYLYTGEGELFIEPSAPAPEAQPCLTAAELQELRQMHRDVLAVQQQVTIQQQMLLDRDAMVNERERALLERERALDARETRLNTLESELALKNSQTA